MIDKQDLRLYDPQADAMIIPEDVTLYVGKNVQDAEQTVLRAE